MRKGTDHPGVYVPPPLVYAAVFLLSLLLQRLWPLDTSFFGTLPAGLLGVVFIVLGLVVNLPALRQFARSGNTVVTIRPAHSLQTSGIYRITRNPMYLALLLLYTGLAFLLGNWWTLLLVPVLVAVITWYVIRREERYLERAFGQEYTAYKKRVRRWI